MQRIIRTRTMEWKRKQINFTFIENTLELFLFFSISIGYRSQFTQLVVTVINMRAHAIRYTLGQHIILLCLCQTKKKKGLTWTCQVYYKIDKKNFSDLISFNSTRTDKQLVSVEPTRLFSSVFCSGRFLWIDSLQ